MRIVYLALALAWMPSPSFATCSCGCVGGEAVSRCERPTDVAPLCMNLCVPKVAPESVRLPGTPPRAPDPILLEEKANELLDQGLIPPGYRDPVQPGATAPQR